MMKSAKIKKRSMTSSDYGTQVLSWVDDGTADGFFDVISISKNEVALKVMQDSTHMFITTKMIKVKQGDRLDINGETYEINYVDNPMMLNHHLEIELKPILEQVGQADTYIYYGFTNESYIDDMSILGLDSQLFKEKMFSKHLEVTSTSIVLAYPKSFGKCSIRLNNKLITNWNINEITVNGVSHYVYQVDVDGENLSIELF